MSFIQKWGFVSQFYCTGVVLGAGSPVADLGGGIGVDRQIHGLMYKLIMGCSPNSVKSFYTICTGQHSQITYFESPLMCTKAFLPMKNTFGSSIQQSSSNFVEEFQ